jgi:putative ABC transport system substrate-binding protein
MPQLGFLTGDSQSSQTAGWLDAFREGLRQAGYIEGQNIAIDYRWAEDQFERLPELAAALVQRPVDIIITGGTPALQAARQATGTIPIVIANASDPVGLGIVASLARPGGNVTGLTSIAPELAPKRLQLLQESVPGMTRVGVLHNPGDEGRVRAAQETEQAARTLGLQVQLLGPREAGDLEPMLAGARSERLDALFVLQGGAMNDQQGATVVRLAAQYRYPAMYDAGQFTAAGGLMFYGVNYPALYRRAAVYVDKILRGTNPADLPIERPTTFDFVINLKTAQALGLTIPPAVLAQATDLIQ